MLLADMHTHSDNSPDGHNSVVEVCESAVAKGLRYIAITDHCEIDLYYKDRYDLATKLSYFDMLKAQTIFEGQIEVLRGIELGNAMSDPAIAANVTQTYDYDFVLGSLHHPVGVEDFAFLDYGSLDTDALIRQYYDEMEQMLAWGRFDVLAHLTYPLRYINGIHKLNVNIRDYEEQLVRVLKKTVQTGKGIEINTSGLRQPYGMTMPDLWCLQLYRKLGGEILTVGSDGHFSKDIGANILDALRLAREAGFDKYCVFKHRKPVFLDIADLSETAAARPLQA